MKLYIKNMVCDRCRMAVQNVLNDNNLTYNELELGEVELTTEPKEDQLQKFKSDIETLGFELIEGRTARIISKIKKVVTESVRRSLNNKLKLSVEVSEALNKDYNSLILLCHVPRLMISVGLRPHPQPLLQRRRG